MEHTCDCELSAANKRVQDPWWAWTDKSISATRITEAGCTSSVFNPTAIIFDTEINSASVLETIIDMPQLFNTFKKRVSGRVSEIVSESVKDLSDYVCVNG